LFADVNNLEAKIVLGSLAPITTGLQFRALLSLSVQKFEINSISLSRLCQMPA